MAAAALSGLLLFLYGMAARAIAPEYTGAWIEIVTVYLIMWAVMLAAVGVSVEGAHVRADFLIRILPPAFSRVVDALGIAAAAAYCTLMAWCSWLVLDFAFLLGERGPSELRIPLTYYYAAYPLAFGLSAAGCALAACLVILRGKQG